MRPVPGCLEEIENAPAAQSTASALEWLEDIETIRGRSRYQGVLSSRIKERVAAIKKTFEVLAVRIEEQGDLVYLKRKNSELRGQLLTSQREIKRLDRRVGELQKTIEELRGLIINNEGIRKADKATSPIQEEGGTREKGNSWSQKECAEGSLPPVRRPPIKGVSSVIPDRRKGMEIQEDAEISRQIVNLVNKRKALRERMENSPSGKSPGRVKPGEKGPKIVSNVQLVPPRNVGRKTEEVSELREVQATQASIMPENELELENEWVNVISKNEKKKVRKKQTGSEMIKGKGKELPKEESSRLKPSQQGIKRRPPRTAAVAIRGTEDGFSYAEALKTLRGKISLPELKIERSHIRKAASGGILIEIPGENRNKKAEELKNRIAGVLGEAARVTRPTVKGEIRIMGMDDSVVPEEVADVLAVLGKCDPEEIKVGTIRPMRNGMNMVWTQGPIEAMIGASKDGKIRIGWTSARIDLLKNRPPPSAIGTGRGAMLWLNANLARIEGATATGVEGKDIWPLDASTRWHARYVGTRVGILITELEAGKHAKKILRWGKKERVAAKRSPGQGEINFLNWGLKDRWSARWM